MTTARIQLDQSQVDDIRALLGNIKMGTENAIRTSLNRTLDGAVTLAAKRIGETTTLKASMIKDNITKGKASNYLLGAKMTIKTRRMPLGAFKATPSAADYQLKNTGKGVLVQVWKQRPSVRFNHAFWAIMSNGFVGIFERKNPHGDRHITSLVGPFLASIYIETPGLSQDVEQTSADRLQTELAHQVDYLLGLNNG